MNKLQCEVCGSLEITKVNDDTFRCAHCGCNYTLNQTRVLFGGSVTAVQPDFNVRAGRLEKYNGESVTAIIPSSVTIIGNDAFADCPGLEEVTIPDTVKIIGSNAFSGCTGLTEIKLPASVKIIEYGAFRGCSGLKKIELPEELTEISDHAFENCKSLTAVDIKGDVTQIGAYAFKGCTSLKEIRLPLSLSRIGTSAFCDCSALQNIVIPQAVSYVGADAFTGCIGISDIVCNSSDVLPFFVEEFSPRIDINGYMKKGLCRFCGGSFRGIFTLRCSECSREKDYKIKKGQIIVK